MIGEIGSKHLDLLPEIIPVLISLLKDGTPAVARQAITCAIDLFRCTLEKVAIQGLYSSELDVSLESSWEWMLKFKDKIYSIAFQIPPSNQPSEGKFVEFNISWLRGGHPVLNVGDLSFKLVKVWVLLLDQLRFPTVKSISNSMIIVLINSLSVIARKRPSFYGRILPVLLGLDPSSSVIEGVHISGAPSRFKKCLPLLLEMPLTRVPHRCQKTKHALWICELCLKESHSRDMVCVGSVGVDACFPV
ncbi:hypothetical protein CK203_039498 [Vitis vinifera]|uniref:Symplekin/Pta1 N-terminal domain-containing protein n=1 Tax=Vitis vinifera TaxID=29760 RepID=A0A438HK99_VITVI|nr:hypothetical protein CK203_039498 [Vitis vinifera]